MLMYTLFHLQIFIILNFYHLIANFLFLFFYIGWRNLMVNLFSWLLSYLQIHRWTIGNILGIIAKVVTWHRIRNSTLFEEWFSRLLIPTTYETLEQFHHHCSSCTINIDIHLLWAITFFLIYYLIENFEKYILQ